MKRSSYRERDAAFGQMMVTLRTQLGLTQVELAEQLHVSQPDGGAVGSRQQLSQSRAPQRRS